jgi:hypothetical protein
MIIDLYEMIVGHVREMLPIARLTLEEQGTHLPTAILHTETGMLPMVLPFKDDEQRRALTEHVKRKALEKSAYAVTTVTCARIVDARTSEEHESLVLATCIHRGRPYFVAQSFVRGPDRRVVSFGEVLEGDEAAMPGQMMIIPEWQEETAN